MITCNTYFLTTPNFDQIGDRIFLTDIARELSEELGQNPPEQELQVEKLKFDTFDARLNWATSGSVIVPFPRPRNRKPLISILFITNLKLKRHLYRETRAVEESCIKAAA